MDKKENNIPNKKKQNLSDEELVEKYEAGKINMPKKLKKMAIKSPTFIKKEKTNQSSIITDPITGIRSLLTIPYIPKK